MYWFLVTSMPAGGAPENIRKDWEGVVLPVRRPRPVEGPEPHFGRHVATRQPTFISDGVAVATSDALRALRLFGRREAAAWWEEFLATRPATTALVFRTWEGRLLPPSYASASESASSAACASLGRRGSGSIWSRRWWESAS